MFQRAKPCEEPCEAIVQPLREKRFRPCGKRPTKKVNGRALCGRHAAIQKQREQAAAERSQG